MRNFKSINSLGEKMACQFTLYVLLQKRATFKTGKNKSWQTFTYEVTEDDAKAIADAIGTAKKTKESIENKILNSPASVLSLPYWMLDRIIYEADRNTWTYCAGQDYTNEIRSIVREFRQL